jgi:adenine-specific DNA-methyltransferase
MDWAALEQQRLALQAQLDGQKTAKARNQLGQFATPTALARDVLAYGLSLLPGDEPVRFLDPAIGTGSFYSALGSVIGDRPIFSAAGFEIDPHYGEPAAALWQDARLSYTLGDFTEQRPVADQADRANLLICNPPYVRHHHIASGQKVALQAASEAACGVRVQGLAGLYCYFLALSHQWMSPGGVAGWLIPSEFMDVNYGAAVKRYLATKVTLLRIHRFDPNDVQFDDALVSSAVVWFRNEPPAPGHEVEFSYGGSLLAPAISRHVPVTTLDPKEKWTRYPRHMDVVRREGATVGDLFKIRRGIATGDNGFFLMSPERAESLGIPDEFLRPILPGTRHVPADEIMADNQGWPRLDRQLLLLNCRMNEELLRERHPQVWAYFQQGKTGEEPVADRYLCRARRPWYAQEERVPAPLLCTYMGRSDRAGKKPFRFFLNHSQAIAGNVYLMLYPKPALQMQLTHQPDLLRQIWSHLNDLDPASLLGEGRVYGGGLHKMEPKELANVVLPDIGLSVPSLAVDRGEQEPLFARQVA